VVSLAHKDVSNLDHARRSPMLQGSIASVSSAAAAVLLGLAISNPVLAAPHDGPGAGCQTHIGHTYVGSIGLIHAEGSGLCNSSAQRIEHRVTMFLQQDTWQGWQNRTSNESPRYYPPFDTWRPVDYYGCPGLYRGLVEHWAFAGGLGGYSRASNRVGC
jgi:hypothetical protein